MCAGRAVPTVANTGQAIPADRVETLFEPFQRLDRTTGREGHHGLGLSVVRAMAQAHEAAVVASPRPGGGLLIEVGFAAAVVPVLSEPAGLIAKTMQ